MSDDPINHPAHYTFSAIEVIDALEAWQLDFHLGNAVKYIARAGRKGPKVEDLKKARWYLDRAIRREHEDDSADCAVRVKPPDLQHVYEKANAELSQRIRDLLDQNYGLAKKNSELAADLDRLTIYRDPEQPEMRS